MATYQAPGVYVEQIDQVIRPIEGVGTSMAAFIGVTAEASRKRVDAATGDRVVVESRLNKLTLVTNWTQFTAIYGEFSEGAYLPDAVYNYFANGGGPCYVLSIRALTEIDAGKAEAASASVPGEKGDAFTITAKIPGPVGNNLAVIVSHDDDKSFTVKVGDQSVSGLTMKKSGGSHVGDAQFDAIAIGNVGAATEMPAAGSYILSGGGVTPLSAADYVGSAAKRTGLGALEVQDDIRLVVCPDLMAGFDGSDAAKTRIKTVQEAIITHCEQSRYRFAILDTPPGMTPDEAREWRTYLNFDSSYAALYYPWLEVADLAQGGTKLVPPSGHLAGAYNSVDAERGVHKAPANVALRGVLGVEMEISRTEQGTLNPLGVNCIRPFANRGVVVWGARTLSSDGAWRYVNVRRLFIYVAASLDAGLQWAVFEPNNENLWARIRRDVNSFLLTVWGNGALFGNTSTQAFYVKCDEELNPAALRDQGQLIIEVGIAPVKPAEFVIFRLSQWAGADSSEAQA
ncbi:MAG: phage tail sheath family protein [Anaerolineales bacterium]|nr:phage tail sheath family protein [Anaerolineales bacterium]